ncbi:class I tRNA ligase family protein, partial [Candidatus Microgenomates bacterium]|nr:class I tRNA ligase family protein [Candidatus Microgenomates bacterium]
ACPECGGAARRETDVSDTFLDSAWYFFRYISTEFKDKPWDKKRAQRWLPVNMYIGGAEHSVLHLLYVRFLTMVFHDLGLIEFQEPFPRFYAHGLIISEGAKMSKSKGNVVVPDAYINKFGADTLRCYLMFLGPYSQGGDFRDSGIEGMNRFLKRVWNLVLDVLSIKYQVSSIDKKILDTQLDRAMNKTIKQVTEDINDLRYNTAIAHIMEYYNNLHRFYTKYKILNPKYCKTLVLLLAPFAPHMTEELFQFLNSKLKTQNLKFDSIHLQSWPKYDPKLIEEKEVTIVIQVNGKMRDNFQLLASSIKLQKKVEDEAQKREKVKKYLEKKVIKKIIYVPGKIINFVV